MVFISAAVPSAVINEHPLLQTALPGLLEAAISSVRRRSKAGRPFAAMCNASPAGDSIPAMIAAGAVTATSQHHRALGSGSRRLCCRGRPKRPRHRRILAGPEIGDAESRNQGCLRVLLRALKWTSLWLALAFHYRGRRAVHQRRVAIGALPNGNAGAGPHKPFMGTDLNDDALHRAGEACKAAASPISDKRGTAEYRKKVVGVVSSRRCIATNEFRERKGGKTTSRNGN